MFYPILTYVLSRLRDFMAIKEYGYTIEISMSQILYVYIGYLSQTHI